VSSAIRVLSGKLVIADLVILLYRRGVQSGAFPVAEGMLQGKRKGAPLQASRHLRRRARRAFPIFENLLYFVQACRTATHPSG
jgi:hypothetical protein